MVLKTPSKFLMCPDQEEVDGFIRHLRRKVRMASRVCDSSAGFLPSLNVVVGIISSLAFSPAYGSDGSYYAAGTFTPSQNNVALFSDAQDEPLMYLSGGPRAGVTQVIPSC